jgi:PKD repeat protein
MKRALTLIVFCLSFFAMNAQFLLTCSGTVTNISNGNPIPYHEVIIQSDSANGTSGYFYHTVVTDINGLYFDTIVPSDSQYTGTVVIKTEDCQNYYNVYTASYGPQNSTIQHDFSICYSNTSCSADFNAYPDSSSNTTFFFYPSYQANVTTWLWDFGDGTNATITAPGNPNITHTYPMPGIYTTCLTVLGANSCSDTKCVTVDIGNGGPCIANFTYSDSTNTSTTVQFTDLSQSSGGVITSWSWNFGDIHSGASNTSALQNPIHTFSYPDTYNICLTIHGSDSTCFDEICKTIYVGPGTGCQAYFTYRMDSVYKHKSDGIPVYFTDMSQGDPIEWTWDFGDGKGSNEQNPIHDYLDPGTYTVCLTIHSTNACMDTYCTTVQVTNTPCSSYFEHSVLYLAASFQGFIYNNNVPSTDGIFSWEFGDGGTSQGQTVTHTYVSPGSYDVTMTAVDSSGCSSTFTELITVYDSLNTHQIYGQVFADNFPITSGLVMIFSVDSTVNYSPYYNIATLDSMGIYFFTMVPDGDYYILAIPILPSGYLPTYYGDVINWENASIVHPGLSFNPYDIHLLSSYTNPSGNGTINGQINMGQIKSSMVDKVTMLLMNNDLQPINFYKVNTAGDFTFPTLSYGTYYLKAEIPGVISDLVKVEISQANPVASVTMTFSGNRILGIDEPAANLTAGTLYPNPVTDVVYLSLKSTKAMQIQINVYSMAGQVVVHAEKELSTGGTIIPISVSNLTGGIYTLRIHSDTGINIIRKLVK